MRVAAMMLDRQEAQKQSPGSRPGLVRGNVGAAPQEKP